MITTTLQRSTLFSIALLVTFFGLAAPLSAQGGEGVVLTVNEELSALSLSGGDDVRIRASGGLDSAATYFIFAALVSADGRVDPSNVFLLLTANIAPGGAAVLKFSLPAKTSEQSFVLQAAALTEDGVVLLSNVTEIKIRRAGPSN